MEARRQNRAFLGIDYGSRRIGLAMSDPTGLIASALTTLEVRSVKEALAKVGEIIQAERPDGIVIGYPVDLSGERSRKCQEIDAFAAKLKGIYEGPVHLYDEAYTSVEAADIVHAHGKRVGKKKGRIDRLAAVLILQRWLDEAQERG